VRNKIIKELIAGQQVASGKWQVCFTWVSNIRH